ncbi:hypothetical protein [Alkalilimnicola ehrlichii]|uniref:hypothetical protein n=1 Tax=Alkalilimnicola ehrlichii TaxID=351052 RepID=UPI0011C0280A|nr:hypothetical protein [Alkalilimnicola ehrlichii]
MVVTTAPTRANSRVETLDVLRGFAILGILIMNIQSFALVTAAYVNPAAYTDFSGSNALAWFVSHLIADQKFLSIFSMLLGPASC